MIDEILLTQNDLAQNIKIIMEPFYEKIEYLKNFDEQKNIKLKQLNTSLEKLLINKEEEIKKYKQDLELSSNNFYENYSNNQVKLLEEEYKKREDDLKNQIIIEKKKNIDKNQIQNELYKIIDDIRPKLYSRKTQIELKIKEITVMYESIDLKIDRFQYEYNDKHIPQNGEEFRNLLNERNKYIAEKNELMSELQNINLCFDLTSDPIKIINDIHDIKYEQEYENSNYIELLEKYNILLDDYENDLEELYDLHKKLEDGLISYEVYENKAEALLDKYKNLKKEYEDINLLYEQTKQDVQNMRIWHPSLTLNQIRYLKNNLITPNDEKYKEYLHQHNIDVNDITSPVAPNRPIFAMEKPNNKVIPIEKKESKPNLTWKTAVAIAAGIGIGATVFFTLGPTGVAVMNATLGIAKTVVIKQQQKLKMKKLNGEEPVKEFEIPNNKLKLAIFKLKEYLKSEEGLRDISWLLTSAILTGTTLTLADSISKIMNTPKSPDTVIQETSISEPQNTSIPSQTPNAPSNAVNTPDYSNIKLGQELGNNVPTTGHDTASWAVKNINAEHLNPRYVNSESVFNRFAILNENGGVSKIISDPGVSIQDLINNGIDPSRIAIDVASPQGTSLSWNSIEDVINVVGKVK